MAIVMTGLILGGAAIVFTEMTEGLGSLLGGFSFSMWLLVLKPGGLLTSTSSKAIFIAAFTVAAFSTSFSHYTRPYGVIGGISFGGATAATPAIAQTQRATIETATSEFRPGPLQRRRSCRLAASTTVDTVVTL